jgi:hypothetical protein
MRNDISIFLSVGPRYPIYKISVGPMLKNIKSLFLTFHNL